jgi:PRTRC genetic system ThiF family protein
MTTLPNFSFFKYNKRLSRIIVLGCGGTGSHAVPNVIRLLLGIPKRLLPEIYLIDGDTVEHKNILRQNFIHIDLGQNKAEVLARRYSTAFGIPVSAVPEFSDNKNNILGQLIRGKNDICIIGCVDSHNGRRHIRSTIRRFKKKDIIWIDSGNEEKAGQVVMGYRVQNPEDVIDLSEIPYNKTGLFSLPFVTDVYPEISKSKDKARSELSCDVLINVEPQAMMVNVTAANLILNYYNALLYKTPLNNFGVTFSITNGFSSMINNIENLSVIPNQELKDYEK